MIPMESEQARSSGGPTALVIKWVGIPILGIAMLLGYGWELFQNVPLLLGRDDQYSLTASGKVIIIVGVIVPVLPLILVLLPPRKRADEDFLVKVFFALATGMVLSVVFVLLISSFMIFG